MSLCPENIQLKKIKWELCGVFMHVRHWGDRENMKMATLQLQHLLKLRRMRQGGQEEVHWILANLVASHLKEVAMKSLEATPQLKILVHSHVQKLALQKNEVESPHWLCLCHTSPKGCHTP
jgi:hypothetical protein